MTEQRSRVFEFGEFRVDADKRLLTKGSNEIVPLTPKVFDTLLYLVESGGRVVEKDKLMSAIWPDTVVEENNLSQNISILRRLLGENRGEHRFIAMIPGRGFKFVAAVREQVVPESAETVEPDFRNPGLDPVVQKAENPKSSGSEAILYAGAAIVLLLMISSIYYWSRPKVTRGTVVKTIAVLPFKPLVAENRDEALEMGIADALIDRLGDSRDILVRPLSSARKFGALDQDPLDAGRSLNADTVLEGNIQRSGDNIRVNARLIDVATGSSLWSGTYDERFTDIFSVQDRIAIKVAEALKIRLTANGNTDPEKRQTVNPEAYRLYLQGRYFSQKIMPAEVRRGIEFFQRAIDADPTYALAYAGMADAYRSLPINADVPSSDMMPKAKAAAEKALEIDTSISDAHIALAWVEFWYEHNWRNAENEFRTALDLAPNNPDAHRGYSVLLTCLGRHDEAIAHITQARQLDPLSLITSALEGQAFLFAGHYDQAIDRLNKSFEIDPNFWVAHIQLARVYIQQKNFDGALAESDKARQFSGGNSESFSLARFVYARTGRRDKALEALDSLKMLASNGLAVDYNTAMVYNGLGQSDEAMASLEKAFETRDVRLILLKVDPKWDNLRGDSRFIDLMKRMNFE